MGGAKRTTTTERNERTPISKTIEIGGRSIVRAEHVRDVNPQNDPIGRFFALSVTSFMLINSSCGKRIAFYPTYST
jgi:hypothetical protein